MSQNDFTLANQSFPAFRADLNSALQALATNSSGGSAPSTTFANMWWYDTSNNIMYIRNEDNDAWIKFAELDQTNDKFVLSGTLQLDDGTVSAPALTFNSDTNMGIYRGGTDILKFVTAGTDAITINASQNVTLAGSLNFADNEKAIFGAGSDLQIYHDATDSRIEQNGTGRLLIRNTTDDQDIVLQSDNGSGGMTSYVYCDGSEGVVRLYRYGAEKLATTSTGIDVTGTAKIENSGQALNLDTPSASQNVWMNFSDNGSAKWEIQKNTANLLNIYSYDLGSNVMTLNGSGNVGIGTSSPQRPLHVTSTDGNNLRLEHSSAVTGEYVGMELVGGDINSQIRAYTPSATNSDLRFLTKGSGVVGTRMTIDSIGNLLVGTTDTTIYNNSANDSTDNGMVYDATDSRLDVTRNTTNPVASVATLNRTGNDGNILNFAKSGTTVGSIGGFSNHLFIGNDDVGIRFINSLNAICPVDVGAVATSNDVIDLGRDIERFKDLYLSGGVYLGGTGSANKLDDYEEGTFEVTLAPETSGTVTPNGTLDTLAYTKIGRMVTITGAVNVTSVSSPVGTYVKVLGLPFTVGDFTQISERPAPSITYFDISINDYITEPSICVGAVTDFRIYRPANTWAANDSFYVNFSYFTA